MQETLYTGNLGVRFERTGALLPAVTRNTIATIRPGDVGEAVISGTVYKQVNRAHITRAVTAFDDENQDYTITFQNGNIDKWKLAQVCATAALDKTRSDCTKWAGQQSDCNEDSDSHQKTPNALFDPAC